MAYNNKHFLVMRHVQDFTDLIFLLQCLSKAADRNEGVLLIRSTSSLAMFPIYQVIAGNGFAKYFTAA